MAEQDLWQWLKKANLYVENLHMRRIENAASSGDPDVIGCWKGVYFELELKVCARPARLSTSLQLKIQKSQVVYHKTRALCGGNNWVLVKVGSGATASLYLVPGHYIDRLEQGISEYELSEIGWLVPDDKYAQIHVLHKITMKV